MKIVHNENVGGLKILIVYRVGLQIQHNGGRRISYPEIFACLPEQFNSPQIREALIANGSTARLDRVVATWINRNQIVEKVAHGSYRKMKHDK